MLRSLVVLVTVLGLLIPSLPAAAQTAPASPAPDRADFFGIVGRDPLYALEVDGRSIAPEAPSAFLDRMAADLVHLGARWVRIEFHAETSGRTGPGYIDFAKYDEFIRRIAPRHGLKVLALLSSGMLETEDSYFAIQRMEEPPDGAGLDPTDLSNNYIRAFTGRAREIADRYGDAVAAYEIFNEPNINAHKLNAYHGQAQEIEPERFGALMTQTYLEIKRHHPRVPVILGGLLHGHPVEKPDRIPSDYLAEVYQSPRVQWFFTTRPLGGEQLFPWDGVALHPYDLSPENVETHIREMKARMASVGDAATRIWITEIGMQAEPPPIRGHWLMPTTPQEAQQADYLTRVYTRLLAMPDMVERVFWFKYEDFRENGLFRNWGLVRLRENSAYQYDPAVVPYPRKAAYAAYQRLANPAALPTAPRPRGTAPDSRYFAQTGQNVSGVFLRYWEANGGLERFGMPRTAPFYLGGSLVQFFERARFEHRPEWAGTPNEVQLGLLGTVLVEQKQISASSSRPLPPGPNTRYFPETRRNLANGFKAYWEENGGASIFGLPITDEFPERNPADGKVYAVQYFERARFEYHPEFRGTRFEVQLGLLGNQMLTEENWYR
jgi:hypothetical protein